MPNSIALALALPATLLIATVSLPSQKANAVVSRLRVWVSQLAAVQLVVAAILALALVTGQMSVVSESLVGGDSPLAWSVHYDGIASLMLALVSFVGWVIVRYSIRYLDGEHSQGDYFRWTAFTIGSVSMLVISGNLLIFMICWILTSLGLHQLLLHYGHRPAARRAAWTKFAISRLGDLAIVTAIVIIYTQFQTLQFSELFAKLGELSGEATPALHWAGWLLVIGAITKSAQFPLHTWLPLTMETPTPISALMHAGIVNAGGYLIIRTSPLISLSPWSMAFLASVGAVTTCFAAMVMLTQTSVKKSLAYSTIAQMGFMMLQCGLGAFSAATLHILAHSLYKAHAFLSSGSVIAQRNAVSGAKPMNGPVPWGYIAITFSVLAAVLVASFGLLQIDLDAKPGGLLLGSVLVLGLTQWVVQAMGTGSRQIMIRSFAIAAVLCLVYVGSFVAVDAIVSASLPATLAPAGVWLVAAIVGVGFLGLFTLQVALQRPARPWMSALYVHASNGFYVENFMRRTFGSLTNS